ncbi:MAG TPA: ABC transporter ATP-binding protein [Candidatus Sulfotelmatobacter sp.]|jgi:putative ABC transport system ATP-binding protein|nr:ABC transporter ATP-binding protein [Candidatus Sulfotelmatobacter sp.]
MIQIKNLVKKFQMGETELIALKNLSFEIPTGQFIAITGRSGAGKSTLLYNISLLDIPTSGDIFLDGQDIAELTDHERVVYRRDNFGFIFQDYALLPTLTAKENVVLSMLMQGIDKKTAAKKAEEALEKVELDDKFDNLPNQLSGGQQQRVSIARSIVHNPKILFADEPTANLDSESSKTILDIFLRLNKNANLTIVMVTHEKDYAKLADRDIELFDGKIITDIAQKHMARIKNM